MQYSRGLSWNVVLALGSMLVLAGCGPRDTRFFPNFKKEKVDQAEAAVPAKKMTVQVQIMSRTECDDYFGIDVIAQGYRPLLVTFENKGNDSYMVRPSYVGLERVSGKEVARLMHYDTYSRVLCLSIPALIYCWPVIPILIVPYGVGCSHYNDKTTRNIRKKSLSKTETLSIAPGEIVQKFVFVPDNVFKSKFDIKLYNETSHAVEVVTIDCVQERRGKRG